LRQLTAAYPRSAPPATFRVLVSPLVSWLWLGALIVFVGGLITIWPAPVGAPRRVGAAQAAKLARELGRA
jgi:cytochrome c-type biogenesis protein CcmF